MPINRQNLKKEVFHEKSVMDYISLLLRACRSVGRSLPLQGRGPGFESQQVHFYALDNLIIREGLITWLSGK